MSHSNSLVIRGSFLITNAQKKEVAKHRTRTTETFQYVATPVNVLTRRHKQLYTLTLTQTKIKIANLGPEFLNLIFK